jgi:putative transposase
MPWQETCPVNERQQFVDDYQDGLWTMTELCLRYGVSRKTGYKWLERFAEGGWLALEDQPRTARHHPHAMKESTQKKLLAVKQKHPSWGARKVLAALKRKEPRRKWPAESTVHALFKRKGLVTPRRRRGRFAHPGKPRFTAELPNDVWTTDFKGQFKTGDGVWCYPLTVSDLASRYMLCCKALPSVKTKPVRTAFEILFRRHGLPRAILSDNGVPFCTTGLGGLSRLNIWWMKLGVEHYRIQPGKPQQNGAHERMHRTLKAETTIPPAPSHGSQQQRFNRWRRIYNQQRPHEALNNAVPDDVWEPSTREMPEKLPKPDYPAHFEVRLVSDNGQFRFRTAHNFLAHALAQEYIGLEPVDDGIWNIYFYDNILARYDERTKRVIK